MDHFLAEIVCFVAGFIVGVLIKPSKKQTDIRFISVPAPKA